MAAGCAGMLGLEMPPPNMPPKAGGKLGLVVDGKEPAGCGSPAELRDGKLPPTAGNPPPRAGKLPPTDGKLPPSAGKLPPTDGKLPPSAGRLPPSAGKLPPSDGKLPPTDGRSPESAGRLPPPGEGSSSSIGVGSSPALSGRSMSSRSGKPPPTLGSSALARRGDGSSKLPALWLRGEVARAGKPTPAAAGKPVPTAGSPGFDRPEAPWPTPGMAGRFGWLPETEGKSMPPRCGAVAGSAMTPGPSTPTSGRSSSIPVLAWKGGLASGAVRGGAGAAPRGDGRSTPAARPTAGRSRSKPGPRAGTTGAVGAIGAATAGRGAETDGRSILPAGERPATAGRSAEGAG